MAFSDEEIIDAFRMGGVHTEVAWRYILAHWRVLYRAAIAKMGGSVSDADDAMMDIAAAFQGTIAKDGFVLSNRLSTYFVRCVVHRWMYHQRKKGTLATLPTEAWAGHAATEDFNQSVEGQIWASELKTALNQLVNQVVGPRCQKILSLFAQDYSMKEIATAMGFTRPDGTPNDDTAKNEKSNCQKKLKVYLLQHPDVMQNFKSYLT